MIPYVLKIQGVRDYPPTRVLLGEVDEHVLITGPNGVGKSTLTFCIGAILYSAKVDIEGLRSSNLQANEAWNAKLSLLFKNEGATRIDASPFIVFELTVHQAVKNGALQKEYRILTGETEDALTNVISYTSGNTAGRNFSAYQEDLQIKYKIDPDLYHLIWYQQEVNQFAAMNPEERFRQFSNMFNIANMQKEWEAALEGVREAEQEIYHLTSIVKTAEHNLTIAENELNAFLNNKNRLIENGRKYYTYTNVLLQKYTNELADTQAILQQLQAKEGHILTNQTLLVQEKDATNQQIKQFVNEHAQIETLSLQIKAQQDEQLRQEKALQDKYSKLSAQLEAISDKAKRLRFDKQTTLEKRIATTNILKQLKEQDEQLKTYEQQLKENERNMSSESAQVKVHLEDLRQKLVEARKIVYLYKSSSYISNQLDAANRKQHEFLEEKQLLSLSIHEKEKTIQQLQHNKVRSARQQQGLDDLHRQDIEAYTLRDLIELTTGAPLKLEASIETIKYTIFYNAASYKPLNDLYYVSLKQLVPSRMIVSLPHLGLQMRSGLTEQLQNYANKALWWIEQFFTTTPRIEAGALIDERGARGPQEQLQFILSDVAIRQALQEQMNALENLLKRQEQLNVQYEDKLRQINQLHGDLRNIQQAESVLLKESELHAFESQLAELTEQLLAVYDEEAEVEVQREKVRNSRAEQSHELQLLEQEWLIYEELGAVAEQQTKLQQMDKTLRELRKQIKEFKHEYNQLTEQLEDIVTHMRQQKLLLQSQESELELIIRNITSCQLQMKSAREKIERLEANQTNLSIKVKELEKILPDEACMIDETISIKWSETKLIHDKEQRAAAFEVARMEKVKIHAEANYEKMKEDFERKNAELASAEILLEKNANFATELEDKLETTINMYLTKINMLFQKYMDMFHFEGRIEKARIEEKSGRIKYLLYVKARKIGHQGTMEDVSLKARNGKVGKGVSGGEESLSSLLFALALLQNLSIAPSYIILDEFDSALDDERKDKVFHLYAKELNRKLIILSPKAHDKSYYDHFSKVFVIEHNSSIPQSRIVGFQKVE